MAIKTRKAKIDFPSMLPLKTGFQCPVHLGYAKCECTGETLVYSEMARAHCARLGDGPNKEDEYSQMA
jgi:hypothetical protein